MSRTRYAVRAIVVALVVALLAPVAAAGPTGPLTPLDTRRRRALEMVDAQCRPAGEDAAYPRPNLSLDRASSEYQYQDDVAAIFGLVDLGVAPRTRLDEANRLLRYELLGRWRITSATQLEGDSGLWSHRSRSLGTRLYILYSAWMDADIVAEHQRRFTWMLRAPYTRSSENIKWSNNSSYLLAHEILGETGRASYGQVRTWVIEQLRRLGEEGFDEWGSAYTGWTFVAILNLAELSTDPEVRRRATMVVDHFLASELGQSIRGSFNAARIRSYPHWTVAGAVHPLTHANQLLFGSDTGPYIWSDFAISNYSPLSAHQSIFDDRRAFVSRATETAGETWFHHNARGRDYLLSVHQTIARDHYVLPSGGTHDIIQAVVQSSSGMENVVVPYPYDIRTPFRKKRNLNQRSFAYDNVALVQNSGATQSVWAGGGIAHEIPARLYYASAFTRTIADGWVFLSDGSAFVAWAPSIGTPIDDPDSAALTEPRRNGSVDGYWLRSDHAPDDDGEMIALEVGDAASFGSFAAFQSDVRRRNPRPRVSGGVLRYTARDGTVLELGYDWASRGGVRVDPRGTPRRDTPWMSGNRLTVDGSVLGFDWAAGTTSGPTPRAASNMLFGAGPPAPPSLSITTSAALPEARVGHAYGPITLAASGGSGTYVRWQLIGGTTLPDGIVLDEARGTLSGTPTRAGSWNARIRVYDSAGALTSRVFSIAVAASEPGTAEGVSSMGFVWSQAGSFITGWAYDPGSSATQIAIIVVRSPVHTDPTRVGSLVADRVAVPDQDAGIRSFIRARTGEEPPAGAPFVWGADFGELLSTLDGVTEPGTYEIRLEAVDQDNPATGSAILATFPEGVDTFAIEVTAGGNAAPGAPERLFVSSTDARLGTEGDPVDGIDSSPVFSAIYRDSDPGDVAAQFFLQVSTDPTFEEIDAWSSGVSALASPCTSGERCADIEYAGPPLSTDTHYFWRMIFIDRVGAWGDLHAEPASFITRAAGGRAPSAPTRLHAGSVEAQTGSEGSVDAPLYDLDLDPVFSAVFADPDPGDQATGARLQVATDASFVELVWDSGSEPIELAAVPNGVRSSDIAFGGGHLEPSTLYFWRIQFFDGSGLLGFPSEPSAFTTAVDRVQPLRITSGDSPVAFEGESYAETFSAEGGLVPYRWSLAGELPSGLAFDDATGTLFGTPRAESAGDYAVSITVIDRAGERAEALVAIRVRDDDGLVGGCGCRAVGARGAAPAWLLLVATALVVRRVRKRSGR